MPRGAAVIEYHGKHGLVYRVKYRDRDGVQVMETIGAARDGVTRKQAEAELRARLARVEQKHYRRPRPLTFAEWSATWYEEGRAVRGWKPHTVLQYRSVLRYLNEAFGATRLASIRRRDVAGYVRDAVEAGFAPRTVNLHLNLLHDVMASAVVQELIEANPVDGVERPRVRRRRWRILSPAEVPRVAAAFTDE